MTDDATAPGNAARPSSDSRAVRAGGDDATATLRHSLRTALNQIIGYSEMLLESPGDLGSDSLVRDLKKIHTAGNQLLALLNDALAAWKVETGRVDLLGLRRGMRPPINAIIGYCELCGEEAALAARFRLVDDLAKIARAAQNLHDLVEHDDYLKHGAPAGASAEAVSDAPVAVAGTAAPEAGAASAGPPGRLLVVDDDPMNREMLVRRLRRMNYEADEAADGRAALDSLVAKPCDLVLLDIVMPGFDGFQTLEAIRATPRLRHVRVIMLTALDDVDSTVRCIEAGADDYVPKPFNPVILRARIDAALEKKRLRDQERAHLSEIHTERAKAERLLLNTLPYPIAVRLKSGERTIVDSFAESTVLFTDIVDFTRISAGSAPARTVHLLNELFSDFDGVVEGNRLEKIKTIGDSYMAVGGVPTPLPDHAGACADAALEMLEAVNEFNSRNRLDWQVRIGMHSGPVVAGIIGTRKFSYDLWGDTVNLASRMEAHGQAGRIQVSPATQLLLRDKYVLEERGMVQMKHTGPMTVFHLLGRKP